MKEEWQYSSSYNVSDAVEFVWASNIVNCDLTSVAKWSCGEPCRKLQGYKYFFSTRSIVDPGENITWIVIVNPTT